MHERHRARVETRLLVSHPPPAGAQGDQVIAALRATYAAQEQAEVMIAASLDD